MRGLGFATIMTTAGVSGHLPLAAQWNGTAWTKVKVPKVGATEELDSAAPAIPGGTITWAFGPQHEPGRGGEQADAA